MSSERHGLSVGIERCGDSFLLSLHVKGKLTHRDYETLVSMLESAVEGVEHPKIDAYVDATELEGWDMHAAWDDLKLGLKHGRDFRRIAVVGNKRWQEMGTRMGSWFIGGEAKFFEEPGPARDWVSGKG